MGSVGQAILPAAGLQAGQCRTRKGPAQPGLAAPHLIRRCHSDLLPYRYPGSTRFRTVPAIDTPVFLSLAIASVIARTGVRPAAITTIAASLDGATTSASMDSSIGGPPSSRTS